MHAVILSFDSLAANSLGCYGNEWIETPNWDRLAAAGAVFDNHFTNSVGSDAGWRLPWPLGTNAGLPSAATMSLGDQLRALRVATKLIVAGPRSLWHEQLAFDELRTVDGHEGPDARPDEVPVAEVVKAGISTFKGDAFRTGPRLLWLHSSAPGVPPTGFESLYFEDFEERGQVIAELSDEARSTHPAVYAGAVSLLDHWLGELINVVQDATNGEPTLLIVTAAKGALWHHIEKRSADMSVAWCDRLTDQCIRAPLVLSVCNQPKYEELMCTRSSQLTQCHHLGSTLIDWFGQPLECATLQDEGVSWLLHNREPVVSPRRVYIDGNQGLDAVRTLDWLLIRKMAAKGLTDSSRTSSGSVRPGVALFAKPEDIWDVNDVASQCPEVVDDLLSQFPC